MKNTLDNTEMQKTYSKLHHCIGKSLCLVPFDNNHINVEQFLLARKKQAPYLKLHI